MRRLTSINIAEMRRLQRHGEIVWTGIWKVPVDGPVRVSGVNVDGDKQADKSVHGGYDKAVYSYAQEDYAWWSEQLGDELTPGTFGENLTVSGINVTGALVGERWRIGEVLLEVSEPRIPCWKLGVRMNDPTFLKTFAQAHRPGAYLRIIEPGTVSAGDEIELVSRPDHTVSMRTIVDAYLGDLDSMRLMTAIDGLADNWAGWAQHKLDRAAS